MCGRRPEDPAPLTRRVRRRYHRGRMAERQKYMVNQRVPTDKD
jgi:hypothetical protein